MKKEREFENNKPNIKIKNFIGRDNNGNQSSFSDLKKNNIEQNIHPQPKEIKENPIMSFISKFWWKVLIPIAIVVIGILIERDVINIRKLF